MRRRPINPRTVSRSEPRAVPVPASPPDRSIGNFLTRWPVGGRNHSLGTLAPAVWFGHLVRRDLGVHLIGLLMAVGLVACGSDGNDTPGGHFTPNDTTAALRKADWTIKSSRGGTVSKVTQTGFLKLTSPDGTKIDVQFIGSDASARAEFEAASKKIDNFHGTVDHNAIIFTAPLGAAAVPGTELDAVHHLLRRARNAPARSGPDAACDVAQCRTGSTSGTSAHAAWGGYARPDAALRAATRRLGDR